jgi:hypothetical protein
LVIGSLRGMMLISLRNARAGIIARKTGAE